MFKPVEPRALLMDLRPPDGPVPIQVEQRLCPRAGAKVDDVATAPGRNMSAAVRPKVQGVEILVLGVVVGVGKSAEGLVINLGLDVGAVDLEMSRMVRGKKKGGSNSRLRS
jgi:hypothetical protein